MRGPFPDTWALVRLPEVVEINPAQPDRAVADDEAVSFVPMAAVEEETGRLDPSRVRPWAEIKTGYKRFQEGDVLFAKITPCMENGKVAVAERLVGGVGAGSTEFHVLRPGRAVLPRYLLYFLLQDRIRRDARLVMQGAAGQLRVPERFMADLRFPLAPTAAQERIVAALEAYFSRLDAAVAALERVRANLKRYRASVLKAACEGRLVPTEAELARHEGRDYEPANILLERILRERRTRWEAEELERLKAKGKPPTEERWKQKYKEPDPPDTTELPSLPEGWAWATLGQLIVAGPQNGLYLPKSAYGQGIPIVRIDDFQTDWIRPADELQRVAADEQARAKYGLEAGDIVLNRVNSPSHLGKCVVIQHPLVGALFESNMMRFRCSPDVEPRFVVLWLASAQGRSLLLQNAKWAVNQASINQQDVTSTPVPLPPQAEQRRIALEYERQTSLIRAIETIVRGSSERSTALRRSILNRAFTGRLVPQDPNDEPASTLLERIRARRHEQTELAIARSAT